MINSQSLELKETTASEAAWYVVQSEVNRERVAKHYLTTEGFEVYLPMRLCSPKSKAVMTPLFPRHMFVQLDMDGTKWPRIFTTIGVAAVLTQTTRNGGARPGRVPTKIVERIRAEEIDGLVQLAGQQRKAVPLAYGPGDKVKVVFDNSKGEHPGELDAIFLERVDANRVLVLMSLLGREWRAPVQVQSLRGS